MTLQSLLELDKEHLLSSLSGLDAARAVRVLGTELDRMLYTFNDQEENTRVRESAAALLQTAKAACSLADCAGEAKIYGRTEFGGEAPSKRRIPKGSLLLMIIGLAGAAVIIVGALLLVASAARASVKVPPRWLLVAVPLVTFAVFFLFGMLLRPGKRSTAETLHAEMTIDPELLYSRLLSVILVVDRCLEDTRSSDRQEENKRRKAQISAVDADELELLSQLLEEAYGRRMEDTQADETVSQIRFYLHKKNIDVVDWTGTGDTADDHSAWFDMMPAFRNGTIRPALAADGRLLKKGMASAGRG